MSILYTPKGRAREYAPLAANLYSGCSHGCTYCYVPTIPPWKFNKSDARAAFHANPAPRRDVIRNLTRDCKRMPGTGQRVMLCFTTDPYQQCDVEHKITRQAIQVLHDGGYNVQVLTKGGSRALRDLNLFGPGDAFATTMTLLSDESSAKWEPEAALPQERIDTIEKFYAAGIPTWISLEPVLNPESAIEIIRRTYRFTDLYKIGKLNHHDLAETIDWADFARRAVSFCEYMDQPYYIKDDLAAFLPDGYLSKSKLHVTVADLEQGDSVETQAKGQIMFVNF